MTHQAAGNGASDAGLRVPAADTETSTTVPSYVNLLDIRYVTGRPMSTVASSYGGVICIAP